MRRSARGLGPWLVAGVIGWAGTAWLGWVLRQQTPPKAGFDLSILLQGARRMLAGQSPYDPAMLAGTSPDATSLFYSYPPPVAQAMTALAWLPDGIALVLWALGATAGLAIATALVARAAGAASPRGVALRAVLAAPLVLPFAIALLFGNLDAWYPLAFGLLVVAVLPRASNGQQIAGGAALGIVSVAKLHPELLMAWLVARAVVDRGGPAVRILGAAIVTALAIIGVSLVLGGTGPWADYVTVLRAGAGATVVDPRNVGPVSLLGQVIALDGNAVRIAQVVVALAAIVATVLAAIRVRDPLASVAVAITASLVLLPVTWYHYPVALIPVGIAVLLRRPEARAWVAVAVAVADLAIGIPPMIWLGVALLLATARRRAPAHAPANHSSWP